MTVPFFLLRPLVQLTKAMMTGMSRHAAAVTGLVTAATQQSTKKMAAIQEEIVSMKIELTTEPTDAD